MNVDYWYALVVGKKTPIAPELRISLKRSYRIRFSRGKNLEQKSDANDYKKVFFFILDKLFLGQLFQRKYKLPIGGLQLLSKVSVWCKEERQDCGSKQDQSYMERRLQRISSTFKKITLRMPTLLPRPVLHWQL